ncbi:MAG: PP2C family protein-serine/threonine phosphatase, partial [Planctomycetota bacterium]
DGDIETLETNGSLLGIFPDAEYTSVTCQLGPGDRLVLHTDGVDHLFGSAGPLPPLTGFCEQLQMWSSFSRPELLMELAEVTEAVGDVTDHIDDVTVLIMDLEHPPVGGPWAA